MEAVRGMDSASGETVQAYAGSEGTEEIVLTEDALLVVTGSPIASPIACSGNERTRTIGDITPVRDAGSPDSGAADSGAPNRDGGFLVRDRRCCARGPRAGWVGVGRLDSGCVDPHRIRAAGSLAISSVAIRRTTP